MFLMMMLMLLCGNALYGDCVDVEILFIFNFEMFVLVCGDGYVVMSHVDVCGYVYVLCGDVLCGVGL